jgi:hypothetical protein
MKDQFKKFADNIRLTDNQEEDAKTKYSGVCEKLHTSYYKTDYNGNSKFLFGSYKTKTNVRPLTVKQDVDVLFKIPKDTFEKFRDYKTNGSAALLQEIRDHPAIQGENKFASLPMYVKIKTKAPAAAPYRVGRLYCAKRKDVRFVKSRLNALCLSSGASRLRNGFQAVKYPVMSAPACFAGYFQDSRSSIPAACKSCIL